MKKQAKESHSRTTQAMLSFVRKYSPLILPLVYERFYAASRSKKQLYNPQTHKLRKGIQGTVQAVTILLLVRQMAQDDGVENFWFSKDELKLLERSGSGVSDVLTGQDETKNLISFLTELYDLGQTKNQIMPNEIADASKRLTVKEVAALLGFNEYTIYKMAAAGRIPCIKVRRHIRFRLSDIEKWEDKHSYGKL